MDEGRILDQGQHSNLMNQNERYSSLIHTFLHEDGEITLSENDYALDEIRLIPPPLELVLPITAFTNDTIGHLRNIFFAPRF